MKYLVFTLLLLLYLLHNDLWLWHEASLIAGLAVGLVYHIVYCFAVVVVMALLIKFAWPDDVADQSERQADS